jgi:hypothetical protein
VAEVVNLNGSANRVKPHDRVNRRWASFQSLPIVKYSE